MKFSQHVWLALLPIFLCNAAQAEVVKVPGSRIMMDRPAGFEKAPNFVGFQNASEGSSIMVTEIPGPYSKVTAGFDQEHMATRGMKLMNKSSAPVGNMQGLLLEVTQAAAGTQYRKWIHAFGNEDMTVLVTATFPDELSGQLSNKLKGAVMTTRFDSTSAPPSEQGDLPFTVTPVNGLKLAARVQNMLLFNLVGALPKQKVSLADNASFLAGQSLSNVAIRDRAEFARRRLQQSQHFTDVNIQSEADVTIGGLPGREALASATGDKGEKLFVYQTILYGSGGYFLMQGISDASTKTANEERFKAIARTFKLK